MDYTVQLPPELLLASTTCLHWRRAARLDARAYLNVRFLTSKTGKDLLKIEKTINGMMDVLEHACEHDWRIALTFDASNAHAALPGWYSTTQFAWREFWNVLALINDTERDCGASLWNRVVRMKLVLLDAMCDDGDFGVYDSLPQSLPSLLWLHLERTEYPSAIDGQWHDNAPLATVPATFYNSPLKYIILRNIWFSRSTSDTLPVLEYADIGFSGFYQPPLRALQMSRIFPHLAALTLRPSSRVRGTESAHDLSYIDWDDVRVNLQLQEACLVDDYNGQLSVLPPVVALALPELHVHVRDHTFVPMELERNLSQFMLGVHLDRDMPREVHVRCRSPSLPVWQKRSSHRSDSIGILLVSQSGSRVRTWTCSPGIMSDRFNLRHLLRDCVVHVQGLTVLTLDIEFVTHVASHGQLISLQKLIALVNSDMSLDEWNWSATALVWECERFICNDIHCDGHRHRDAPPLVEVALLQRIVRDFAFFVLLPVNNRRPIELTLSGVELSEGQENADPQHILECFASVHTSGHCIRLEEDVERYCHS
ncbi:hypothetical protein BKA62DRAFT_718146 [Auriculariales sp. MPI-PUGE-AT-0066]|nr:hypothetical protein BKA62DRAFT_718146 [Auriculariales sp. MPI-PUGE-AT-0066]